MWHCIQFVSDIYSYTDMIQNKGQCTQSGSDYYQMGYVMILTLYGIKRQKRMQNKR